MIASIGAQTKTCSSVTSSYSSGLTDMKISTNSPSPASVFLFSEEISSPHGRSLIRASWITLGGHKDRTLTTATRTFIYALMSSAEHSNAQFSSMVRSFWLGTI